MPPSPPPASSPSDSVSEYAVHRFRLLSRFAQSEHAANYILRGSTVLRHWYGAEAREPQDLDLVAKYGHDPERTIAEVLAICHDASLPGPTFPVQRGNMLPMWEYDVFPGVRFHVPPAPNWRVPTVQLDIAYDYQEEMPREVIRLEGPPGHEPIPIRARTREACLASKVCWIASDLTQHGQVDRNDVADALLLTRDASLSGELVSRGVATLLQATERDASLFTVWDHDVVTSLLAKVKHREPMFPDGPEADRAAAPLPDLLIELTVRVAPMLRGVVWFPQPDEWPFLLALYENPGEAVHALALADWLQEQDDPRGEWLHLTLQERTRPLTETEKTRLNQLETPECQRLAAYLPLDAT
jgi:uncharacterized protein (TIGR02996 family)